MDGSSIAHLFRKNDELWILVPSGNHEVSLKGRMPKQNTLQLPLPLRPHHVSTKVKGWTVEGIHENGIADRQLQFKRVVDEGDIKNQILETGVLPPFVLIERVLLLGLNWTMETTVQRIGPTGSAIVLDVPLLDGESVVSEGVRVKDGMVQISMDSKSTAVRWESILERADEVVLSHAQTDQWTEMWHLDVSPIFHVESEGIQVILHQQGDRWYPTWHPWPGEEVKLMITRPKGVPGQTITIDRSHLEVRPGQRSTDATLTLSLRSSQGGQHTITLPEDTLLQNVRINGTLQPIRQEGRLVPLPIKPGHQEIVLQWQHGKGLPVVYKTPIVDLGIASVNCNIDLKLPRNRWPLFMGGPLMGPAVLFWSVVLVLVAVAFGLSRTGLTPLSFHHWVLLGIGMSQSTIIGCLLVVGWLIALELRQKAGSEMNKHLFDTMQIGICLLTVFAVGALIHAISQGLLGHPDMNILGNGSNSSMLRWYQDHNNQQLPRAWLVSIPMFIYRLAMLAWALWLSFFLVRMVKWGWNSFSKPFLWQAGERKKMATGSKNGGRNKSLQTKRAEESESNQE